MRKKLEVESSKSELRKPKVRSQKSDDHSALDKPHSQIQELPTGNSKLQTEKMEVHHHPEVEKKGFKEYILEGLMIFIAVMMGFFAESIRENIGNNERAKQLATQLVSDQKNDTATMQKNILYLQKLSKRNDTTYQLLLQPITAVDKKKVQKYIDDCYYLRLFTPSIGAITTIKNNLQLKQFSGSKISQYITDYEYKLAVIKAVEDIQINNLDKDIGGFFKDHFTPVNAYAAFNNKPIVSADMRNLKQDDFDRLAVDVVIIKSFNDGTILAYKNLKEKAVLMMKYVQKQYHLDN